MNYMMDDFYQFMKNALHHFGLSFSEMDKVRISAHGGKVTFAYNGQEVSLQVSPES